MYFTGNDGYQSFLVFAPVLGSLILDSNKKVTNWILTGISSEKIKSFDTKPLNHLIQLNHLIPFDS